MRGFRRRARRSRRHGHIVQRDEERLSGWQSGLTTFAGKRKPGFDAFRRAAASLLAP